MGVNFLFNLHRGIYEHIPPLFFNFYLLLLCVKAHTCEGHKTVFVKPVLSFSFYVVTSGNRTQIVELSHQVPLSTDHPEAPPSLPFNQDYLHTCVERVSAGISSSPFSVLYVASLSFLLVFYLNGRVKNRKGKKTQCFHCL